MRHTTNYFLSAVRGFLLVLMFLLPIFFLPLTIEPLEFHKQTLLLVLTCAAALCWLFAQLTSRTITLRAGWLNALPLALLAAFLVPALFSVSPYLSWVGAHRQEYTSVLTIAALAILFYLLANTFGGRREHRAAHLTLLLSAATVALATVLEILGVPMASRFVPSLTFNTVGTLTSLATWLVAMSSFFLAVFVAALQDHQIGEARRQPSGHCQAHHPGAHHRERDISHRAASVPWSSCLGIVAGAGGRGLASGRDGDPSLPGRGGRLARHLPEEHHLAGGA